MENLGEFLEDIDDTEIEANHGRPAPIPAGDYTLELVEKEFKETKDSTGIMFVCQFKVSEGGFEGRRVYANFNIRNRSDQAQRIGISQVKGFCASVGVPWEEAKADTSILIGRPFLATVGFSKTTDQYPDPRNEIKAFKAPGGEPPAAKAPPKAAAASKPTASAGSGKRLPWQKTAATEDNIPF